MVTNATPGGEVAVRNDVVRAGHSLLPRLTSVSKIAFTCLALIACADSGLVTSPTTDAADQPVATEIVGPATSLDLEVGQVDSLDVRVLDQHGVVMQNAVIEWTSSDTAVATVDEDGAVKGKGIGRTRIVASHSALSRPVQVTVEEATPVATEIVASEASVTLRVGQTHALDVVVLDQNGVEMTDAVIGWTSSDPAVATVDASGAVGAVRLGTASIVASHEGLTATVQVSVEEAASVATEVVASESSITLQVGQSRALDAVVLDQFGVEMPDAVVDWTSSNPAVATVDGSGTVEGVGSGTAGVVARHGSLTATVTTTVQPAPPSGSDSLLFRMDLSAGAFPLAGFDGIADPTVNRYAVERVAGLGPSGQPAYRLTVDTTAYRSPGQPYLGWSVRLPEGGPISYGGTVFVRFRMRWVANARCESWDFEGGNLNSPVPETMHRTKFHIINDDAPGGNSEGRTIIQIDCDSNSSGADETVDRVNFSINRANGDQKCETGYRWSADQTWLDVQYQHTWSSSEGARDGTYKIWINNNTQGAPDCEINAQVLNTNGSPGWFRWGFYMNRPPRGPVGRIGYELTDYQIGTAFDANWNN